MSGSAAKESSANGQASTMRAVEASTTGQKGLDTDNRQELMDWQQRIAEVLWWGGGEPFREEVRELSGDAHITELCKRLGKVL